MKNIFIINVFFGQCPGPTLLVAKLLENTKKFQKQVIPANADICKPLFLGDSCIRNGGVFYPVQQTLSV